MIAKAFAGLILEDQLELAGGNAEGVGDLLERQVGIAIAAPYLALSLAE